MAVQILKKHFRTIHPEFNECKKEHPGLYKVKYETRIVCRNSFVKIKYRVQKWKFRNLNFEFIKNVMCSTVILLNLSVIINIV